MYRIPSPGFLHLVLCLTPPDRLHSNRFLQPEPSTPEHCAIRSSLCLRDPLDPRSQKSRAWSEGISGAISFGPAHTTHTLTFSESRCMIFQGAHHHLCRSQVVLLPSASLCPRPARTHFHTRGFLRPVSEKENVCFFIFILVLCLCGFP